MLNVKCLYRWLMERDWLCYSCSSVQCVSAVKLSKHSIPCSGNCLDSLQFDFNVFSLYVVITIYLVFRKDVLIGLRCSKWHVSMESVISFWSHLCSAVEEGTESCRVFCKWWQFLRWKRNRLKDTKRINVH